MRNCNTEKEDEDEEEPHLFELNPRETSKVLDNFTHLMSIDDADGDAIGTISEKMEKLVTTRKKQLTITDYFR